MKKFLKNNLIIRFIKDWYRIRKSGKSIKVKFKYLIKYLYYNKFYKDSPLNISLPWISFSSFDFLQSVIGTDFKVFEYGSGGSTLFFLNRVNELISVEHDLEWKKNVEQKINKRLLKGKHEYFFVPPINKQVSLIEASSAQFEEFRNSDFIDYVAIIDKYDDNYFDLIVIDGRARPSCLKKSVTKVKPGGYILFDNSERAQYQEVLTLFNHWIIQDHYSPTITSTRFTKTAILQRPYKS